jgi:hypothetical protein
LIQGGRVIYQLTFFPILFFKEWLCLQKQRIYFIVWNLRRGRKLLLIYWSRLRWMPNNRLGIPDWIRLVLRHVPSPAR